MIFSCDNQNFIHISTNLFKLLRLPKGEPTFKKFYPDNSFSINFDEEILRNYPLFCSLIISFICFSSCLVILNCFRIDLNFLSHSDIPSTFYLSDSVSLPHIVSTLPKDLTCFLFGLCELIYCVTYPKNHIASLSKPSSFDSQR